MLSNKIGVPLNGSNLTSYSSTVAFIANSGIVKEGVYALTPQVAFSQLNLSLFPNLQIYKDPLTGVWSTNAKAVPFTTTKDLYVDVATGNDTTGTGTELLPYKTIAKGISRAFPSITVHVKAGTYTDNDSFRGLSTDATCTTLNVIAYGGTVIANYTTNATDARITAQNTYFEGITFTGAAQNIIDQKNYDGKIFMAKNCNLNSSKSANGLSAQYNGLFILENCTTDSSYLDGFNYHNSSTVKNQLAIEVNCTSTNSGTQVGGTMNNGSTMHDGGNIIRINGNYSGGQNRTIHDINNCVSVNLGCKSDSSKEANQGNWAIGMNDTDSTVMYLIDCETSGATNKGYQYYGSAGSPVAKIYTRNCTNTCGVASDTVYPF